MCQARNQDFMWGGTNEAKVDQTTEMYFLLSEVAIHILELAGIDLSRYKPHSIRSASASAAAGSC